MNHWCWKGISFSLSVLMAIFRVADTRMSPFWILLELRVMEVVMTAGAIRNAKLQSNHHQQQTNQHPAFYRPDALPVAQPTVSEHWREGHMEEHLGIVFQSMHHKGLTLNVGGKDWALKCDSVMLHLCSCLFSCLCCDCCQEKFGLGGYM